MKRLLVASLGLVLILVLFTACESPTGSFTSPLSPPAWIIGEWDPDGSGFLTWVFTTDNAVHSTSGTVILDLKQMAQQSGVTVSDSSTATSYSASMSQSGTTQTYDFEKVTNTTLNYTLTTNGMPIGPIELTKQ